MSVKNIHHHNPDVRKSKITKVTKVSQKTVLNEVVGIWSVNSLRSEVRKNKIKGGTKKFIKAGKTGKIMAWNKGNSNFLTKKDEFDLILQTHEDLALGIFEANIEPNCNEDSMKIEGYTLQLDNLEIMGHKTRTAAHINDDLKYERRRDLEPPNSPTIWIEINGGSPTAWLIFF